MIRELPFTKEELDEFVHHTIEKWIRDKANRSQDGKLFDLKKHQDVIVDIRWALIDHLGLECFKSAGDGEYVGEHTFMTTPKIFYQLFDRPELHGEYEGDKMWIEEND